MAASTFTYRENRNGVPYEAIGYNCRHDNESSECPDEYCGPVGQHMLEWWNNLPSQWRDREVVRTRLINGQ